MSRRQEKAKAEIERAKAQAKPARTAKQIAKDIRWAEVKSRTQAAAEEAEKKAGGGR